MARKEKKKSIINATVMQAAVGVFVFLLAVMFLLSAGTHLSVVSGFLFSYLFGYIGYYGFPFLLIILALGLFIPKLGRFNGLRFIFGYFFMMLGICGIYSAMNYKGAYAVSDYHVYAEAFAAASQLKFGFAFGGELYGGLVGFAIANLFGIADYLWLVYLLCYIAIFVGLVVAFFPVLAYCVKRIKRSAAESKQRKEAQEKYLAKQAEQEEHERQTRIAMEQAEENANGPKRPSNPLDSLTFEPAKNAYTIPSRVSRNKAQQQQKEQEKAAEPAQTPTSEPEMTYPHASAPRVMPNPSADTYRASAPKIAGLQEAFFDPFAGSSTPAPAPAPASSPVARTTPNVPQPQQNFEATTLVDLTPSFIPTASTKANKPIVEEPVRPEPQPQPTSIFETSPSEQPYEEEPQEAPVRQGSLFDDAESFAPLPSLEEPAPVRQIPQPAEQAPVAQAEAPAKKEKDDLQEEDEERLPPYQYPPLSLLSDPQNAQNLAQMEEECAEKEAIINQTFMDLGVGAHVAGHTIGPSVTRYAIQPDRNVSVASLARYVKDIEVRIGGVPTRYAERVTGMTTPALETANNVVRMVSLKECIQSLPPINEKTRMIVPFGVKITGECVYANLCEFPHLLLAGTTGSGKSVFVHSILLSLIMRNRPEELKLVLVDPKRVEMTKYKDIPHLLCPIVKEPVHAKNALKKLVEEMERRYRLFDHAAVQKIEEYNSDYAPTYHKKKLPYIVIVVDEFADLVQNCKEVSEYVLTLGAKARACGIHMIIATQRPDSKVISGTIKANLPTAVALSVRSSVDSQVILGSGGAEDLAGHGDMLIDCAQIAKKEFVRAQGCFVDNKELRAVPDYTRLQQQVKYHPAFLDLDDKEEEVPEPSYGGNPADPSAMPSPSAAAASDGEAKYQYIKSVIMTREFASISQIQRDFSVGFPRAGKIFARLQKEGIVDTTPVSSSKGCRVLVHEDPSSSSAGSVSTSTTEPSWKSDPEEDIA